MKKSEILVPLEYLSCFRCGKRGWPFCEVCYQRVVDQIAEYYIAQLPDDVWSLRRKKKLKAEKKLQTRLR